MREYSRAVQIGLFRNQVPRLSMHLRWRDRIFHNRIFHSEHIHPPELMMNAPRTGRLAVNAFFRLRLAAVWFSLWSALAHQGDVYPASCAAVPTSCALAMAPDRARAGYLQFPAWVEICRKRQDTPVPPGGGRRRPCMG